MSIQDYTYHIPEEKIATHPLPERDTSKLLIYQEGNIRAAQYRQLADYLPPGSLLVFNNTKVVEARLLFKKPSGGLIEIFCLEPHEQYPDISAAMRQKEKVWWNCLVGGASKWKPGQLLEKKVPAGDRELLLRAAFVKKNTGSFTIELSWSPGDLCFSDVLHQCGAIPLPPYIKRAVEKDDSVRYQTVYAKTDGSVAAPTAGLHFTDEVFSSLEAKQIKKSFLTLHVGAGTFKPVKSETMQGHEMHAEWFDVPKSVIETLLQAKGHQVVAVGTTSLRTLESLYWIGEKFINGKEQTELGQWEAYDPAAGQTDATRALQAVLHYLEKNRQERLIGKTQLLVAPGYRFRIIDGLITNFHQPQSTLLLLVAALVGDDWKKIYGYALEHDFRFLSYGDGCLLWKKKD